jgi:hypothetical protein
VPCIASEAREDDIGHNGTDAKRLAQKADVERVAHEAVAAIGADEIARPNDLFTSFADKPRRHAVPVLLQSDQLASELGPAPELDEALAHHAFGEELRHQQRDVIGFGGRRGLMRHDSGLSVAAVVAIFPLRRIEAADRDDAIDDAEILEDLLRSRLDALAARAAERIVHLLDQAEGYAPARKVDPEREAGSAGAANQHLQLCHRHLIKCNMHIIGGSAWRQEKECKMHICPSGSGPCTEH